MIEIRRSNTRMIEPSLRRRLQPPPSRTGLLAAAVLAFTGAGLIAIAWGWL